MNHYQTLAFTNRIKMNRQLPQELLLTKEGFEEYIKRLKEETALEYGMTIEEWDEAIREGKTIASKPITDKQDTEHG